MGGNMMAADSKGFSRLPVNLDAFLAEDSKQVGIGGHPVSEVDKRTGDALYPHCFMSYAL